MKSREIKKRSEYGMLFIVLSGIPILFGINCFLQIAMAAYINSIYPYIAIETARTFTFITTLIVISKPVMEYEYKKDGMFDDFEKKAISIAEYVIWMCLGVTVLMLIGAFLLEKETIKVVGSTEDFTRNPKFKSTVVHIVLVIIGYGIDRVIGNLTVLAIYRADEDQIINSNMTKIQNFADNMSIYMTYFAPLILLGIDGYLQYLLAEYFQKVIGDEDSLNIGAFFAVTATSTAAIIITPTVTLLSGREDTVIIKLTKAALDLLKWIVIGITILFLIWTGFIVMDSSLYETKLSVTDNYILVGFHIAFVIIGFKLEEVLAYFVGHTYKKYISEIKEAKTTTKTTDTKRKSTWATNSKSSKNDFENPNVDDYLYNDNLNNKSDSELRNILKVLENELLENKNLDNSTKITLRGKIEEVKDLLKK